MFSREKMLGATGRTGAARRGGGRMKSIGNARAERLLSSSFQLSPLPVFSLFFSPPPPPSPLVDLELGHGRSSSGPISLNSRGVHEVCEMAKRNPEVRKGRKRAMRAKTKGDTYKRKTRNASNSPSKIYRAYSPLGGILFSRAFVLETRARYY